ncbi:MAG: CHAP domain-containing protein [Oscillospiraceae bacterium]|nr:CHAP domain-containing protein [Oscillospiraceae bacterium]
MENQRFEYALTAARFLGIKEGSREHQRILDAYNGIRPLPRGYALKNTDPWCAGFVSAAAVLAGVGHLLPLECSCAQIIEKARRMGIWVERDDHVPQIGDWILYNWDAKGEGDDTGAPDHVGVVIGVDSELFVVEGNYENAVKLRTIPRNWEKIRGFVSPRYRQHTFRTPEDVPDYAQDTIRKLCADGSLRGISDDDLGLTEDLIRTLVILDRRGKL